MNKSKTSVNIIDKSSLVNTKSNLNGSLKDLFDYTDSNTKSLVNKKNILGYKKRNSYVNNFFLDDKANMKKNSTEETDLFKKFDTYVQNSQMSSSHVESNLLISAKDSAIGNHDEKKVKCSSLNKNYFVNHKISIIYLLAFVLFQAICFYNFYQYYTTKNELDLLKSKTNKILLFMNKFADMDLLSVNYNDIISAVNSKVNYSYLAIVHHFDFNDY